jgi:hypothetical protein
VLSLPGGCLHFHRKRDGVNRPRAFFAKVAYTIREVMKMINWKNVTDWWQDATDWFAGIVFVLYLLALGYIGTGGQNILIILFAIAVSVLVAVSIIQGTNKFLEEYYWNKRETRNSEKFFKDLYHKKLDDNNYEGNN